MMTRSVLFAVAATAAWAQSAVAFSRGPLPSPSVPPPSRSGLARQSRSALFMSDDFTQETPEDTQERIQALVDNHPVLLFMKGSKLFPQCGFSNTATQILQAYNIDFHTVDVLADEAIRSGVKDFSQWPTIPQLYVAGEFIGGSDIMIELYQSGELGELIEKAKADMM